MWSSDVQSRGLEGLISLILLQGRRKSALWSPLLLLAQPQGGEDGLAPAAGPGPDAGELAHTELSHSLVPPEVWS